MAINSELNEEYGLDDNFEWAIVYEMTMKIENRYI